MFGPPRIRRRSTVILVGAVLLPCAVGVASGEAASLGTYTASIPSSGTQTQSGRPFQTGTAQNCSGSVPNPGLVDSNARHVAVFAAVTTKATTTNCLTVTSSSPSCTVANAFAITAYTVGAYTATNPSTGWIGDAGTSTSTTGTRTFSVPVPAEGGALLAAVETTANTGCPAAVASVTSLKPWALVQPELAPGSPAGLVPDLTDVFALPAPSTTAARWQRCTISCTDIPGANGPVYLPVAADVGLAVRAIVTATDGGGTTEVPSVRTGGVMRALAPRPANDVVVADGATIAPATTLVPGTSEDDDSEPLPLPFPITVDGQTFAGPMRVSTNGFLIPDGSTVGATELDNEALPSALMSSMVAPYWDDLTLTGAGNGVFTSTTGAAPDRTFAVEWRGKTFSGGTPVSVEATFRESSPRITFSYGAVKNDGVAATAGLAATQVAPFATQIASNQPALLSGRTIDITPKRTTLSTGEPMEGQPITAVQPPWRVLGEEPALTTRWSSCAADGSGCTDIPGATDATFTPTRAEVGRRLRAVSTAANSRGTASTDSPITAAVSAAPPPPPSPPPTPPGVTRDRTAPKLSAVKLSGSALSVGVSERATLRVKVERRGSGRKVGKRCVAPSRKNRRKRHCTRYTALGTVTRSSAGGATKLTIPTRIGKHRLTPGKYRLTITAVDTAGNVSKASTVTLTVKAKRSKKG